MVKQQNNAKRKQKQKCHAEQHDFKIKAGKV
jgi:hypothetical protein